MNLVNMKYGINIELHENIVNVVAIENPEVFADIVRNINDQVNGLEGAFVLSENDNLESISKKILFIDSVFNLDCNDKKILTKIYKELCSIANDELMIETKTLSSYLVQYMEQLSEKVPYGLMYSDAFDVTDITKLMNVKLDVHPDNLLESIMEYLRSIRLIFGFQCVIFMNLKYYLSTNQLNTLYEFCFYEKISICIFEGRQSERISNEKYMVLDKDLCIIDIDMN